MEIEKAIEQMKRSKEAFGRAGHRIFAKEIKAFEMAISALEAQLKNRWIPVSERLPEVAEGTEDADCPEFNVTIKGAKESTTLSYSWDGTWFDDSGNIYEVLAWMPLLEPYKAPVMKQVDNGTLQDILSPLC